MNLDGLLVGSLRLVGNSLGAIPLLNRVPPQLAATQRGVVRAIRQHLETVDPPPPALTEGEPEAPKTPTDLLRALLYQSMYTSTDDSRDMFYLALLKSFVPDEARVLAALSDGSAYPVIHVAEPGLGSKLTYVLKNASTVGRSAGVSLPFYTPLYVTRMLRHGLARLGSEADSLTDEYDILLTDAVVRAALVAAQRGVRAARVIRQTVRISELGQDVWEAAK